MPFALPRLQRKQSEGMNSPMKTGSGPIDK